MTSKAAKRVLLIGDSILNRTYYVRPNPHLEIPNVPVASLNEECLELEEGHSKRTLPHESVQGIAYIARYLRRAYRTEELGITVWTGTGRTDNTELIAALKDCDGENTMQLDGPYVRLTTRILRNITPTRITGQRIEHRPQLRFDTPPRDNAAKLESLAEDLDPSDVKAWVLRVLNPDFIGAGAGALDAAALHLVEGRVNKLQHQMKARCPDAIPIIDLRVIPLGLRVAHAETILCTTISRLRDYWRRIKSEVDRGLPTSGGEWANKFNDATPDDEVVRATFFNLSPLRAVVCFAGGQQTLLCYRPVGADPAHGVLATFPAPESEKLEDGFGLVTGGDAYVAALVDAVLDKGATSDLHLQAARMAHAALMESLRRNELGAEIYPENIRNANTIPRNLASSPVQDARLGRLAQVLERIKNRKDPIAFPIPGASTPDRDPIIAPVGGKLSESLEKLRKGLEDWRPSKGRDLIAVFGESRAGKEFALKALLKKLGYTPIGPVNMYQFLAETRSIIGALGACKDDERKKRALLIDEVQPGDAARPLLNLMAEKEYTYYTEPVPGGKYDMATLPFDHHPVFLLSSVAEQSLLADLQGRIYLTITIAPLRERIDEIPFGISRSLTKLALNRQISISYRFMDALLHHDYLPRQTNELNSGLDQRNFRALEDLLSYAFRQSENRSGGGGKVELIAADLPIAIRVLGAVTAPDDKFVVYPVGYLPSAYPDLP